MVKSDSIADVSSISPLSERSNLPTKLIKPNIYHHSHLNYYFYLAELIFFICMSTRQKFQIKCNLAYCIASHTPVRAVESNWPLIGCFVSRLNRVCHYRND